MVEQLQPTTVNNNASVPVNNEASAIGAVSQGQYMINPLTDQERFLPIANINRIMKNALPSDTKISKEARECVQECVSEFIAFITCECCDIT